MPTFTDAQGVEITYYEWLVPGPRAIVQIAHGVGEHAGRYVHVARALNDAGYSVVADDHRGHGQTGLAQWDGDVSKLGRLGPGGLRATIAAVRQLSELIRSANPGVPLVLLGHSWGSLMGQIILNSHAELYDAAVLTGTAYRAFGSMNGGDLNKRHKTLGTTGAEWLSRDPEVAAAFVADPLTFPADIPRLFGIADTLRLLGRPARDLPSDLPILVMIGDDDSVGGRKSVERLVRAYRERSGIAHVSARIYPDARHEVFNETNKEEVFADLVAWLDENVRARV